MASPTPEPRPTVGRNDPNIVDPQIRALLTFYESEGMTFVWEAAPSGRLILVSEADDGTRVTLHADESGVLTSASILIFTSEDLEVNARSSLLMRTMLESFPEWAGDSYWIVNAFDAIPEDMLSQGMGGYTETRGPWEAELLVIGSGLILSVGAPDA